jgi:hypothetical protein
VGFLGRCAHLSGDQLAEIDDKQLGILVRRYDAAFDGCREFDYLRVVALQRGQ